MAEQVSVSTEKTVWQKVAKTGNWNAMFISEVVRPEGLWHVHSAFIPIID